MNLLKLKLKALGLVALLFCVFTSCDQLLPTAGSGVDIPVKIRAVSVSGGDQTEITTRASGESERRIIGEPIVQDLGDGLFAEISVEEDVSALRANLSLAKDVKLRIIALNKGTSIIYSWADYTATTSGEFSKVAGNLHVVSDVEYDFVCFSYNSTTASLPTAPSEGGTLSSIAVNSANDFLYKKWTTSLSATSNTLSFILTHQLAQVKVSFAVSYSDWKITKVNSSPTFGSVASPSAFAHGASTLSGGTAGAKSFTGWPASASTQANSSAIRLVPVSSSSSYTLTIPKQAITLSGTSLTVTSQPTIARTATLTTKLEKGKIYTLRVNLKGLTTTTSNKFAGSNIYWDGSQLTFDANGTTTNTKYQGVYFKWGSLIGISPIRTATGTTGDPFRSGTTASSGQTDGTTIYLKVNGVWKKTNVTYATTQGWFGTGAVAANETGSVAWDPIPYDSSDGPYGESAYTLLTNHSDFAGYRGDICNYINSSYRMPTGNELMAIISGNGRTSGAITVPINENNHAGRFALADNNCVTLGGGHIFPASGYRNHEGKLGSAGDYGYYWSGSASSETSPLAAYNLFSYYTGSLDLLTGNRKSGNPVRCVKN